MSEQLFFNLSPDLFCIVGTDGYFKKVNLAFERVLGLTNEEILRQEFINFVYPDDRIATTQELEKVKNGTATTSFENRFRCQDGSYRWLSWTIHSTLEQGFLYGVGRDITQRKQTAQAFQENEERLQFIVDASQL